MEGKILFEKNSRIVNNLRLLQRNVFLLYSPRKFTIQPATIEKIDTEVTAFLPKKPRGYITSKFKTDEINELFLWKTLPMDGSIKQIF